MSDHEPTHILLMTFQNVLESSPVGLSLTENTLAGSDSRKPEAAHVVSLSSSTCSLFGGSVSSVLRHTDNSSVRNRIRLANSTPVRPGHTLVSHRDKALENMRTEIPPWIQKKILQEIQFLQEHHASGMDR